jgi:hypothetical protein
VTNPQQRGRALLRETQLDVAPAAPSDDKPVSARSIAIARSCEKRLFQAYFAYHQNLTASLLHFSCALARQLHQSASRSITPSRTELEL